MQKIHLKRTRLFRMDSDQLEYFFIALPESFVSFNTLKIVLNSF